MQVSDTQTPNPENVDNKSSPESGRDITADELHDLIDDEPTVDENAVEKDRARYNKPQEVTDNHENLDKDNTDDPTNGDTVFDSRFHCVDSQGQPVRTKTGKFRRKRGAKNGTKTTGDGRGSEAERVRIERCKATGRVIATTIVTTGVAIGGDEWKLRNEEELDMLSNAWGDYLMAQNIVEIPPWVGLLIAHSIYAAPRLAMPKTQGRIKTMYLYARDSWRKMTGQ